jgi:hypothetical protein
MAIATFDSVAFYARYPEFAAVSSAQLGALFLEAGLYLDNTDRSRVDVVKRGRLLDMLTAHIAFLGGLLSADGQPRPVGRVSQASEGTVSATFADAMPTAGSGAWFQQSQYGSAFWQATSSMRGMRYLPKPTRY